VPEVVVIEVVTVKVTDAVVVPLFEMVEDIPVGSVGIVPMVAATCVAPW